MKTTISKDKTTKFTFPKGHSSVLIPMGRDKLTLCLSSQIGCSMGCTFCLSGKTNFKENLPLKELKNQLESSIKHLKLKDIRTNKNTKGKTILSNKINSIVFMGMGEPLNNLNTILKFCEHLNETYKYSFSKITISTSGIIPKMKELIDYKYPIQLALSLHSTKQKVRNKLMPGLKQYPIKNLIEVCHQYNKKYKQKIMIEYLMIDELTDTEKDLQNLINFKFAKHTNFNLIPLNPTQNTNHLKPSALTKLENFKESLRASGYKCFIRESMGQDIKAACGMLR